MRQIHHDFPLQPSAMYAFLFRLSWVIGLALVIDVSAFLEASAQTVTPAALSFQAVQGAANPPSQTVVVSKSNARQRDWTATDNAAWLLRSPSSGTMSRTTSVGVSVNITGLAAGTYSGMVTITVNNVGSVSVPVTLRVVSAPASLPPPPASPPPPPPTSSTKASLTWGAVTSTNLAGYKVYMGTASGRYGTPLDIGNVTSYVVSNLSLGTTYYFVVTSYSTSGSESPYSNEVSKSIY